VSSNPLLAVSLKLSASLIIHPLKSHFGTAFIEYLFEKQFNFRLIVTSKIGLYRAKAFTLMLLIHFLNLTMRHLGAALFRSIVLQIPDQK